MVTGGDGDADAGADDAAEILGAGRHGIKGDGCAEIDDDAGSAVFGDGGDGVDDAVRADFAWVVIKD